MKISAIKCRECGDIVYSRARPDFRWCSCKACAIEGGFDYTKITADPKQKLPEVIEIEVKTTKNKLFKDWNGKKEKFGLIKKEI